MTKEEAIKRLEYDRDMCCFDPTTSENGIPINADCAEMAEALGMAINALEQTKWIPVSDRLPEESLNSVIGWDAFRERCVFVQFFHGRFQIVGRAESFDIKAWMPLPEPYKAESEDKE